MARSRNIKPSIMDNEDLAALPALTRLLFIYMWMLADRDGRLEDRPSRIKKQALGYDDGSSDDMLNELALAGFIERYEAQGTKVIQILAFTKHQTPHVREAASELPACSTSLGEAAHQPKPAQDRERDDTHLAESLRREIIDRDGGKCLKCASVVDLHVDHIVPRARGGKTELGNLQTLCRPCNQQKGARNQDDFRKHQPRPSLGECSTSPRSPDSGFLIPDTPYLIPDSLGESAPAKRTPPTKPVIAKPDDVSEQTWADWLQLRKSKKAPVTLTVVAGAKGEADKAGMTLEEFLRVWCRRGSQGLEASWLKETERAPPAESFRERDDRLARERYEEATGKRRSVLDITPSILELS